MLAEEARAGRIEVRCAGKNREACQACLMRFELLTQAGRSTLHTSRRKPKTSAQLQQTRGRYTSVPQENSWPVTIFCSFDHLKACLTESCVRLATPVTWISVFTFATTYHNNRAFK